MTEMVVKSKIVKAHLFKMEMQATNETRDKL